MRSPARILIADDSPASLDILRTRLVSQGYEVVTATDGQEAVDATLAHLPDLILLDVMMPKRDGFEICRLLRADPALLFIPIILVTAKDNTRDIVAGLDSGADEYLTKPVDHAALTARVRSILRTKALHDTVQEQAAQLAEWNRALERRVADQVAQIERMSRLKRFLAPQLGQRAAGELLFGSLKTELEADGPFPTRQAARQVPPDRFAIQADLAGDDRDRRSLSAQLKDHHDVPRSDHCFAPARPSEGANS